MSLASGGGQAGQGYPAVRQSETKSVSPTLTAYNLDSRSPQSEEQQRIVGAIMETQHAVRRLTPTECERLQGFPDDWTLIPFKGKDAPQTHRYKALGNSMAVPVMGWLGQRIQAVDNILNEMDERPSAQATKQTSLW
jgi:DNA (cytosine-5)-methyltransferase 1